MMPGKTTLQTAALLALLVALLSLVPAIGAAQADPMKCSNEEKTCATNCKKAARGPVSACLTACGARASYCMKTGCWNDGGQIFCGLSKL